MANPPKGGRASSELTLTEDEIDRFFQNVEEKCPFPNFDAHNLAAGGIHVVEETLRLNEVKSSQELYEKARTGAPILVPKNIKGNPKELWNPNNRQ